MRKLGLILLAVATAIPLSATELDGVTVLGYRLSEGRKDIIKAEDRFYALYNQLNQNDDLDMRCSLDRPTGSLIPRRLCKPGFFVKAEEQQARRFLSDAGVAGESGADKRSPQEILMERRTELLDNMRRLMKSEPQLAQLLRERNRLEMQYKGARETQFKGRLVRR